MNKTLVSFLLLSIALPFSLSVLGQGSNGSEREEAYFKRSAKNQVSEESTVHTYELEGVVDMEHRSDEAGKQDPPQEIEEILEELRSESGVRRASFDHATKSLTVLSVKETELPSRIEIR